MQCQICKKAEATIHLTEIVDGHRSEMHICQLCAQNEGIAVKSQIPLNELLSNLLSAQPKEEDFDDLENETVCPDCGFTLDQFRKEGVLGCPGDYEIFKDPLMPLLEKAHAGNTIHKGKLPSKMPADDKGQQEIATLKQQLQAAVEAEDYETAAKLRDKISNLERL